MDRMRDLRKHKYPAFKGFFLYQLFPFTAFHVSSRRQFYTCRKLKSVFDIQTLSLLIIHCGERKKRYRKYCYCCAFYFFMIIDLSPKVHLKLGKQLKEWRPWKLLLLLQAHSKQQTVICDSADNSSEFPQHSGKSFVTLPLSFSCSCLFSCHLDHVLCWFCVASCHSSDSRVPCCTKRTEMMVTFQSSFCFYPYHHNILYSGRFLNELSIIHKDRTV